MKHICALGLFRSGTNFTRALLEMNFNCTVEYDSFGWKHSFFPIITNGAKIKYPEIGIILITKNPFSALKSLFQYAGGGQRNFISEHTDTMKGFLRNKVVVLDGSNPLSAEFVFNSPIDYWNAMNWNLESVVRKRQPALHVRYEDLVAEPQSTCDRIAGVFELSRTSDLFTVPEKKMKNLGNNQHDTSNFLRPRAFNKDEVINREYMAQYDDEDRRLIQNSVDRSLIDRLGYADLVDAGIGVDERSGLAI